jgi:hypothetical protein
MDTTNAAVFDIMVDLLIEYLESKGLALTSQLLQQEIGMLLKTQVISTNTHQLVVVVVVVVVVSYHYTVLG